MVLFGIGSGTALGFSVTSVDTSREAIAATSTLSADLTREDRTENANTPAATPAEPAAAPTPSAQPEPATEPKPEN